MAHRVATDPRLDRAKCEFAKLFDAYLKQGQRGDGTPERRWRPWGSNEFAGVIGVSPNTVRNWRRPDRLIVPDGILPVLDTLFGNEPEFLHQRAALEIIWKQAKGIAPLDEESLSGQELNDIFLSRPPLFAGIPPRIALFARRDEELDRIHAILAAGQAAAVTQLGRVALPGMGGVGKTALAVEYAHSYRDHYAGVWWCSAERPISLLTSLAKLATDLGVAAESEPDIEKAAKAALRRLAEQRANFLLVYDSVAIPEDITGLLPAGGPRVLITSRFADWRGWAEEVPLDVLPLAEAVSFLQNRTGRRDDAGAKVLAVVLGRLPLALDHAAAYCSLTQMSFAEYATKAEALIAIDPPRATNYPRSVAATFDVAIAEVVRRCPAAESLMDYLALCAPERIPLTLVEGAIADEAERTAALLALTEMSLVKRDPFEDGTPAVTVHRLVQTVACVRAKGAGRAASAVERVTLRLAAIYPDDGYQNPASWPLCEQLTPHLPLGRVTDITGEAGSADTAALLGVVANYFRGRAFYSQAEPLLERALAIREAALGPDHPGTADSLGDLASLLRDQGDLAGARPLFERALAISLTALGPDHQETATILNNLAGVLWDQGDLAGARPLFERALAIFEMAIGLDHPETATSLSNLAGLLHDQDNLTGVRPRFERALAISLTARGPDHPKTATILNNLAGVLWDQGDLAGARPLFERALAIFETALGPNHRRTATNLNNLATLLKDQGDLAGARPLFERALAIREAALGPDHPETATSLNNLADLLQGLGDLTGARPLFERALAIREAALGPKHPRTAGSLNNLAYLLQDQGDLAGARPLFERALAICETALGPDHPQTAIILNNVAGLLRDQGDLAGARPLCERALAIFEKAFGRDHPQTAISLNNLTHL